MLLIILSKTKRVIWWTHRDEKTCLECMASHGKTYPVGKAPALPHDNCQCRIFNV
jgi:hypothetical protein